MTNGDGPAEPLEAGEQGTRPSPESVVNAVQQLVDGLALVPHLRRPDGMSDESVKLARMGEALTAVLDFLNGLNVPVEYWIPLVQLGEMVAGKAPRSRGGQPKNSSLLCVAIQRLIDAGMTESDAIKEVSDRRVEREYIREDPASLRQVDIWWSAREDDGSWLDYQHREKPTLTVEQAIKANAIMFSKPM